MGRRRATANPRQRSASSWRSWIWTALIVVALIGGALGWRLGIARQGSNPILPRTSALIAQKLHSLESYNQAIPEPHFLQFLEQHLGKAVQSDVLAVLTDLITREVLPLVWAPSQDPEPRQRFVAHLAMARVIHDHFPQRLLANGDIILFPDDQELRVIVSEPAQDFFRDSGWHWRWMDRYLDGMPDSKLRKMRELDLYAAEELSELLSVLGVASIMIAARDFDGEEPLNGRAIQATFARITGRTQPARTATTVREVQYSEVTKRQVLALIPQPMFHDVTATLNMNFIHATNEKLWHRRDVLELPVGIAGGGVASGDYDGDGYPDLFFASDGGGRLYRNVEASAFEDVTAAAGLEGDGESRAGYFIDYDNDGDLDLYVTFAWRSNRLYRNDGPNAPGFADITDQVGLNNGQEMTHGAVWFDMDNDGLLDLYTANFGAWPQGVHPTIGRINTNGGPNRLYHHRLQDGRHIFTDVGGALEVDDRGWTHCVGAWDYDQDGYMDLFSLNDFGASLVYHNVQGQRFVEVSRTLYLDASYNAMNFTLLDLEHDGHPAIFVSEIVKLMHNQRFIRPTEVTKAIFGQENLSNMRVLPNNKLYRMHADGTYEDVHETRLEPANHGWAWSVSAFDYENDSDADLLILNGTESASPMLPGESRENFVDHRAYLSLFGSVPNVCYLSQEGYFYDVSEICPMAYEANSRSATFFDYDVDGDLDVAINDYNGPARIFQNSQQSGNAWVRFQLEGTRSNRDAIGARVEVRFADQARYDQVVSGSGFLAQNPMALHFGLGEATAVDRVVITWPSGIVQKLENLAVNQTHHIHEPIGSED